MALFPVTWPRGRRVLDEREDSVAQDGMQVGRSWTGSRVPRVVFNPCRKPRPTHGFRVRNSWHPGLIIDLDRRYAVGGICVQGFRVASVFSPQRGRQSIAQGVSPGSAENVIRPGFPFPGLTPWAIDCRPSGARTRPEPEDQPHNYSGSQESYAGFGTTILDLRLRVGPRATFMTFLKCSKSHRFTIA
jgi:hypothetical protein